MMKVFSILFFAGFICFAQSVFSKPYRLVLFQSHKNSAGKIEYFGCDIHKNSLMPNYDEYFSDDAKYTLVLVDIKNTKILEKSLDFGNNRHQKKTWGTASYSSTLDDDNYSIIMDLTKYKNLFKVQLFEKKVLIKEAICKEN